MSELKSCPLCGGNMKLEKVTEGCGTDGSYLNWRLSCTKCGMTKEYAADDFYGREYYSTKEEVVNDWNGLHQEPKMIKPQEKYFKLGKEYIVKVSEKGIIPIEEFKSDRFYDKDHDDLDFLTNEEKMIVINDVLYKIRDEILEKCFNVPYNDQVLDYGLKIVKWSDVRDILDKYMSEVET